MAPMRLRLNRGEFIDDETYFRAYARSVVRQQGGYTENGIHHLRNYGATLLGSRKRADDIVDRELMIVED